MKYDFENFAALLSKLRDPVVFLGLAQSLKVNLFKDEDKKDPRDSIEILEDVLKQYKLLPRRVRKEYYKMIKEAL